ncbi:MAG: ribosome maturation factor RimM [Pyrinomonadaceae bacterium]
MKADGEGGNAESRESADLTGVELVAVARVAKVRGLRGEVAADLLTDFPERFELLEELITVNGKGERRLLALESHWFHGGRVILKFAGYDTPETAAALVGLELTVPEAEAVELEDGEVYDWQLIGCRAETIEGRDLGTVREVLHLGGDAPPVLVIRGSGNQEHLVPFAESICVEIDIERQHIRVDAPDGLLEP